MHFPLRRGDGSRSGKSSSVEWLSPQNREFDPKLDLARRTRIVDDTESGSFKDLTGRPEIGMIRRIEQIAPELDRFPFPRNERADDRAVDRRHARGADVSD